jgi:hypothetical protein
MPVTDELRPARNYSWPSFEKGHTLSTRHGAWSDRQVQPIAEAILQDVLDDPQCQYLTAPRFAAELRSWAVAEARTRLVESYLARLAEEAGDELGDLGDERVRAAYALHHRTSTRAMSGRDRLGLSPAAAARLGRDRTAASLDVALVMKELHRLEQAGVDVLAGASEDDEEDGDDDC